MNAALQFNFRRRRGDEAQIEEKLETPHVVSYEMEACRAEAKRRRIKGIVVLPVREIRDVIFVNGFKPRQGWHREDVAPAELVILGGW